MRYVLVSLVTVCNLQVILSMSLDEYAHKVNYEMDRKYTPLTGSLCRTPLYQNLKSCKLYLYNRQRLLETTKKYLTSPTNHWGSLRSEEMDVSPDSTERINDMIEKMSLRQSTERYHPARSKRAAGKAKKRGNPCAQDKTRRTIMFQGVDVITGQVVELLQDPGRLMFQTYFTRPCLPQKFRSFKCEVQYLEYLTAVFAPGSYNVIIRPVRIPMGCALSYK